DLAPAVPGIDEEMATAITSSLLTEVIDLVPDEWIVEGDRERYLDHLQARLADRTAWLPGGAR
ncbi:MAG TPA: aminotransferase class I and II, partial [Kribbella sp.]|nr:aminotransferase class I and II [Kribbella sp.]